MKHRSFLRNGLLVAFALVMLASMPLGVSADPVDDRDQGELEDEFAEPSETAGYTEPYTEPADILEYEYECAAIGCEFAPARELAQVGAYDAIGELDPEHIPSAEVMELWEGVDPSEVFDDQDDSDE
jgi:hypothetical protein